MSHLVLIRAGVLKREIWVAGKNDFEIWPCLLLYIDLKARIRAVGCTIKDYSVLCIADKYVLIYSVERFSFLLRAVE